MSPPSYLSQPIVFLTKKDKHGEKINFWLSTFEYILAFFCKFIKF